MTKSRHISDTIMFRFDSTKMLTLVKNLFLAILLAMNAIIIGLYLEERKMVKVSKRIAMNTHQVAKTTKDNMVLYGSLQRLPLLNLVLPEFPRIKEHAQTPKAELYDGFLSFVPSIKNRNAIYMEYSRALALQNDFLHQMRVWKSLWLSRWLPVLPELVPEKEIKITDAATWGQRSASLAGLFCSITTIVHLLIPLAVK